MANCAMITVRLPVEERDAVRRAAGRRGVTMNQLCHLALLPFITEPVAEPAEQSSDRWTLGSIVEYHRLHPETRLLVDDGGFRLTHRDGGRQIAYLRHRDAAAMNRLRQRDRVLFAPLVQSAASPQKQEAQTDER